MGPGTAKRYPDEWIGEQIVVIHMGGSSSKEISEGKAEGLLMECYQKADPALGVYIPHIIIKGDDGRLAFIPFHGITYVSKKKAGR